MLRLVDSNTDRTIRFERPRGAMVRMCVGGPPAGRATSPDDLRAALVADIVRRVLEDLHDYQVFLTVVCPPSDPADTHDPGERDLNTNLGAVWIPPPADITESAPEQQVHLVVSARQLTTTLGRSRDSAHWLAVGPVEMSEDLLSDTPHTVDALLFGQWDPLAVRMALLAAPYGRRTTLDSAELRWAEDTLDRWRGLVAQSAEHPSSPIPRYIANRAYAALDDNFSVAPIFALLTGLEHDPSVAPGAKFETFTHLDRILGLDLARYLGAAARR
jgi:cysteinyl-tRNA synthetase